MDFNPWTARTSSLNPDFIIIDFDPLDSDFKKAIETAKSAKKIFDNIIDSLCKNLRPN